MGLFKDSSPGWAAEPQGLCACPGVGGGLHTHHTTPPPSHPVCPVVCLGSPQHAMPPLRFLLDLLEEVWGAEDPHPAGGGSPQRLGEPWDGVQETPPPLLITPP